MTKLENVGAVREKHLVIGALLRGSLTHTSILLKIQALLTLKKNIKAEKA